MTRILKSMFAAFLAVIGIVGAGQAQSALMTRHVRTAVVSAQAKPLARLPAAQVMRFDIVLALRHAPELENFLQELYDPASPSYRHFLTVKEFTERFGPSQEDYDALIRFAEASGFQVTGGSRDAMDVQLKGTVAAVEKAFHITIGVYQHPEENRTFYAPDREPTVDLPFQLWHISGLDNYSIPRPLAHRKALSRPAVAGSCPGGYYCGSDMRAAYYGSGPLNGSGQVVGLLQYAGYNIADVNTYFTNVHQTRNVPIYGISTDGTSVNCVYPSCDDAEQTLDITQAISMAPGLAGLYVYVGSSDTAILSSMSTHAPLPAQLSASWVWRPADPAQCDPFFQKFAAQGQNFFAAAGDWYAWAPSQYAYPPEDAYVTGVGGTDLTTTGPGGAWASETAWAPSGGGISIDSIPIPNWQQLTGVINAQNQGSKTLRNGPDVAGESNFDFYVCSNQSGCGGGWGGTSFAAPMWAGFMALVNQQAVANGMPLLGFINPTIYPLGVGSSYTTLFHDVSSGNNGFPAVPNYDLVTGWGSPIGAALISALTGSGGPAIAFTPTSLKFGKLLVGTTSVAKNVTVKNKGTTTLNITNIAVTGDFSIYSKTCGSTLAPGKTCSVKIVFAPTLKGTRTGNLVFTDNAPGSPQAVPLSGTGLSLSITPTAWNYGIVTVGQTSSPQDFTVKNMTSATVTLNSISVAGTASADFKITNKTCGSTLAGGANCTVTVVFKPLVTGILTANFRVVSDGGGSPQTAKLTGTGG
ncbi:MAG TPA: choice-of-anchor D domain-containing protein [Terriglobales bacterium]|nr:choice-of-anchor D domain-containing protein [Terriglobales bacterium]